MIIAISGKIGSGKDTVARIIQVLMWLSKNPTRQTTDYWRIWFKSLVELKFKNPIAAHIDSGWEVKKFAEKLKQIIVLLTGCKREDLEDQKFKDSLLNDEWQIFIIRNYGKVVYELNVERDRHFPLELQTEDEAIEFCKKSNSQHSYTYEKSARTYRWLLQCIGTDLFRRQLHPNVHVNATFADYNDGTKAVSTDKELQPMNWLLTDLRFLNEAKGSKKRGGINIRINRLPRLSETEFDMLVCDRLDISQTNADRYADYAEKLNFGYDEYTNEYIDNEEKTRRDEHESETALDNYTEFDEVIENEGNLWDLILNVHEILIKYKLIQRLNYIGDLQLQTPTKTTTKE